MSEAKFTRGEWKTDGDFVSCMGKPVCAMGDSWISYRNGKANAHLIAASPDMYAILEYLREDYGLKSKVGMDIDALLARARGE